MAAIHLHVVELERYWHDRFEKPFAVFAPHHQRVGVFFRILIHDAIQFCLYYGRCADNHAVFDKTAFTFSRRPLGKLQIIPIELFQIIRKGNIAKVNPALPVCNDDINDKLVKAKELSIFRQQVKLFYIAGSPANAPAHQ